MLLPRMAFDAVGEDERRRALDMDQFAGCILDFTGVNDPHDDDVDALAAAYDVLAQSSGELAFVPVRKPTDLVSPWGAERKRGGAWG